MFRTIAASVFAAATVVTLMTPIANAAPQACPGNSICLYSGSDGQGRLLQTTRWDDPILRPPVYPRSARNNTYDDGCVGFLYEYPGYGGEPQMVAAPTVDLSGGIVQSVRIDCE